MYTQTTIFEEKKFGRKHRSTSILEGKHFLQHLCYFEIINILILLG